MADAAPPTVWTIKALLAWTTDFLATKGVESPRAEAQILLAHVLKCNKVDLLVRYDEQPSEAERARFRELIHRRVAGWPVAYLVGTRDFYLLSFEVTPAVLIPRPETETLVLEALAFLKPLSSADGPRSRRRFRMHRGQHRAPEDGRESHRGRCLARRAGSRQAERREARRCGTNQVSSRRSLRPARDGEYVRPYREQPAVHRARRVRVARAGRARPRAANRARRRLGRPRVLPSHRVRRRAVPETRRTSTDGDWLLAG